MADYILDVMKQTSKLDWAFPFQRTGAFPLDRSSLFSSLEDALAYASGVANDERKLGGTSYVGQPISVYDEDSNSVTLYIINPDRTLKEVGSTSSLSETDNVSIEIVDGKIQLKDFGVGYYAYVPAVKDTDGNVIEEAQYVYTEGFKAGLEPRVKLDGENLVIAWYEPSGETADDIAANLEILSQKIDDVEADVAEVNEAVQTVQQELANKANASDVYTKTETESKIKEEIDKLDHLKRTTVAGIESIVLDAEDADQYIYMVPNTETGNYDEYMVIDGELEKVGDWSVDLTEYAKTVDLDNKVDKDPNARLMTNAEGDKLESIEEGAEKNYISSVSSELEVLQGLLSVKSIPQSKVENLSTDLNFVSGRIDTVESLLNAKVDKEANARLMTTAEAEKLAAITDLIKSVNSTSFSVSEEGQLNLKDIDLSKISGLQDQLNSKVSRVYTDGQEWTLLSPENQKKLAALTIEGDNIEISGSVNADNVLELASWITGHRDSVDGLFSTLNQTKLDSIELGAQRNYISSVDPEFTVTNGNLELESIDSSKVAGLLDLLSAKADTSTVTSLSTSLSSLEGELALLSNRVDLVENKFIEYDARLTWQNV
jgi:hypothetical protein